MERQVKSHRKQGRKEFEEFKEFKNRGQEPGARIQEGRGDSRPEGNPVGTLSSLGTPTMPSAVSLLAFGGIVHGDLGDTGVDGVTKGRPSGSAP